MRFPEYEAYDAVGLAKLIRQGEISSAEVLETAIERIELLNPAVNAIAYKMYDQARAQLNDLPKNAPFSGVPFLLKDLGLSYANVPTSSGSLWLKDYTRSYHSELVQRYLNSGLVIVGKTTTPEFGLQPITESKLFGATRNPWNLDRSAGGSSGGAAAAVSMQMVPMAQGGDGAGSIRIPASNCAIFGFKPTRGRTPTGPNIGRIWQGLAAEHALTKTVRDNAALLDCTQGNDIGNPMYLESPTQPYIEILKTPLRMLRIALIKEPFFKSTVNPDCITAVERSAKLCTSLGHQVEEVKFELNSDRLLRAIIIVMSAELAMLFKNVSDHRPRRGEVEIGSRLLAKLGNYYTAREFSEAIFLFDLYTRRMGEVFNKYDIVLTPTVAQPPMKIGAFQMSWFENLGAHLLDYFGTHNSLKKACMENMVKVFATMPYTTLFNITGQPAMSVPLYWNRQNLPIGSQFVARFADDATLFQLAHQLEQAQPWQKKLPPILDQVEIASNHVLKTSS
jgi:amidase